MRQGQPALQAVCALGSTFPVGIAAPPDLPSLPAPLPLPDGTLGLQFRFLAPLPPILPGTCHKHNDNTYGDVRMFTIPMLVQKRDLHAVSDRVWYMLPALAFLFLFKHMQCVESCAQSHIEQEPMIG